MAGRVGSGCAVRTDVCVIGAGPAGLTVAHELLDSGLHVLVLEAGPGSPPAGGVDVETTLNVGLPYCPRTTRSSGVGGSSLRWDVETPLGPRFVRLKELDEIDFEARPSVTGSGWPFSRAALEPHYRRARELFGIAPAVGASDGLVHPEVQRKVYSFAAAATFTERIPRLLREHPRVTLRAGCVATEVRTDACTVTGVVCRSADGEQFSVEARIYVLAGGAIENARLLLASRSQSPAGVGNRHDLVGRHFMEHPHYTPGVAVAPVREAREGTTACGLTVLDGTVQQDKFALTPDVLRREGLLNAAYKIKPARVVRPTGFGGDGSVPQPTIDAYFAARLAWRSHRARYVRASHLARLGAATPALVRYATRRSGPAADSSGPGHALARVMVMGEQQPSRDSRVRLGSTCDRFGVPLAELDWRLSALDIASMVRGQLLVAQGLSVAVGARILPTIGPRGVPEPDGGAHHMGTTRMSRHPSSGVVDADCRVHEVRNLFVAGSSVFPTGGAANPTLTIVALAARLAQHLVREVAAPVPATAGRA